MAPIRILLLLAVFLPMAGAAPRQVTVAAAANLTEVFGAIGPAFEASTGIHPVFSFGSTAQLAAQIEHGAPFDVFAAADSSHVEDLERRRLLTPGSRAVYATGVLAMWVPPGRHPVTRVEDLVSPEVRIIAIARPELAPYGAATVEVLKRAGIWDKVRPKVVYAPNISMVKQYGASGNADVVFTALSLLLKVQGNVIRLDTAMQITQSLGIPAQSKNQSEAKAFADFLLRGRGREILLAGGYKAAK